MSRTLHAHSRATRNGTPAVLQLDHASRVRIAFMRRDVSTKLRLPVNGSTIVRLAVARLVDDFEKAIALPDGALKRVILARDVARGRRQLSWPVDDNYLGR